MRTHQDLVQIVANGGGLSLKRGFLTAPQLIQLVANAGASGAKLVLRDLGIITQQELVQIAANGKGNVFFVLDD
jgi:hypothetical protein